MEKEVGEKNNTDPAQIAYIQAQQFPGFIRKKHQKDLRHDKLLLSCADSNQKILSRENCASQRRSKQ